MTSPKQPPKVSPKIKMAIIPIQEYEFTCQNKIEKDGHMVDAWEPHTFMGTKVYRLTGNGEDTSCAICPVHGHLIPVIIENLTSPKKRE